MLSLSAGRLLVRLSVILDEEEKPKIGIKIESEQLLVNFSLPSSAAVQPLFGQVCNIFGRRWLMLTATALFTLGSGICGGATSGAMLIAGRAVQGAGSGGVVMIVHIILADMVPLRERGYYLAIILTLYGLGLTLSPFIGGAMVDRASWRWAFYINLRGSSAIVHRRLRPSTHSFTGCWSAVKVYD